jgi:SagB-type dehydrogenase family enzyme
MTTFDASRFPHVGVGLEYHWRPPGAAGAVEAAAVDPVVERLSTDLRGCFDFVEFQPSHYIFEPRLLDLRAETRILLHCANLSLGSVGIPMDREFMRLAKRLLDATRSPWFSEHISWTSFHGGDTQHFILPTLAQEVANTVVDNATALRRFMDVPLLLENAPRTFALRLVAEKPEGEFISDVIERSGAGFLLDLDSAVKTANALQYELGAYLRALPLDRLIEIHTGNPLRDKDILRELCQSSPVKAVTLDWDVSRKANDPQLLEAVAAIRAFRPHTPVLRQGPAADGGRQECGHEAAEALYKISEATSFTFRRDSVLVRTPRQNATLELPARLLPLLCHFRTPQSIPSALLLPGVLEGPALGENFAFLRELIHSGVLSPHAPQTPEPLPRQSDASLDIWAQWDSALGFYLDTRTTKETPYISALDLEESLSEKALKQRRPSAYKDYRVHPFYPLENPLTLSSNDPARGDFLHTLVRRRTSRTFGKGVLRSAELSLLLYYTWGAISVEKNRTGHFFLKKTSPAGGALHGAEVYPILLNVEGFDPGVYHYSVRRHGLELLSQEDPRAWLVQACGGQAWIADAAAVFLSTACVERMAWKYEFSRALRVVLLDIGHLSQAFSLVATWLGLRCCTIGALRDEIFEEKLGLDHLAEPVFLLNGVGQEI